MDQTKNSGLGSGLGNYLSVEILYDCNISPYTKMKKLYENKKLAFKLANAIKYIVKLSFLDASIGYLEHLDKGMSSFIKNLRKDINSDTKHKYNFHPDIVLTGKENFSFRVYRQKKDSLGNEVVGSKIIPCWHVTYCYMPPADKSVVLHKPMKCAPCYSGRCKIKTHACMNDILPEEVAKKVMQLIK